MQEPAETCDQPLVRSYGGGVSLSACCCSYVAMMFPHVSPAREMLLAQASLPCSLVAMPAYRGGQAYH